MKFAKLFFRGNFEDAYAYMGWLNCVSCDRVLAMYNLEYVAEQIDSARQPSGVASYCFARNDWLSTNQFRALMRDEGCRTAFFNSVEKLLPQFEVEVSEGHSLRKTPLNLDANVILDIMFYNSRLYLGAETGVFDADIDWREIEIERQLHKRHDGKCLNLSGRLGMVNASCGNDGLFSAIDDFGVLRPERRGFERTATRSVRSGWLGYLLANYPSNNSVAFFHTSREVIGEPTDIESHEPQIITGISNEPYELGDFIRSTLANQGVSDEDIQYSFNSSHLMFYYTFSSLFLSFHVRERRTGLTVNFKSTQKAEGRRILSAQSLKNGSLIIEADDRVFLFSNNIWHTLLSTGAISVRTFPRSKRFQNLIAITTEEGVHLVCAIDDSDYLPS